jgi:stearoyl-CoA desaturase (delta-9 desaturase)
VTSTGFVNSVCHKWGSRAQDSRGCEFRADDSRNNSFVAVVAGGEGNHSWHHADPTCPRHGRRVVLDADAVAAGAKPERGWHPDAQADPPRVAHRGAGGNARGPGVLTRRDVCL